MKLLLLAFSLLILMQATSAPPLAAIETINTLDFWLFRLLYNMVGYATMAVPAFFIIRHLRKIKYNETGSGCCYPMLVTCVFEKDSSDNVSSQGGGKKSIIRKLPRSVLLLCCVIGLQGSYLTWGVIQERIMTKTYGKTNDLPGEKFSNSQFLVFVNRLLAFTVAALYVFIKENSGHNCPLYKFSFASFSNIMSSWFQYEALKFVSFPTQVLGKACKVIPVMLMGKVVSGNVYQLYEWITAAMLSFGISLFLFSSGGNTNKTAIVSSSEDYSSLAASLSGFILMIGYMAFDSFTSNWQGELFKKYRMSSMHMMFGVNMFSCLFTAISLLEQGGFIEALAFMMNHSDFALHSVILSICSAFGQLFIFFTIAEFGPVVFTIIMTLRQAFAILLSCFIYGHPVTVIGALGVLVVFAALFLRIYARNKTSKTPPQKPTSNTKV